ncbi:hypothetical protein ACFT8W_17265 [Streptomyces hygroscopicus]|uniref:hypothetical protein n=1 Tax=Streptomyces hygroscopicus TaxID=1912 RepID=UPI003637C83D
MASPERKRRRDCIDSWQARYRGPSGKQTTKNFDKKGEAEDFPDDVRARVRRRTYNDKRIPFNPAAEIEIEAPLKKHADEVRPPTREQCALFREHTPMYTDPSSYSWNTPAYGGAEATGLRWAWRRRRSLSEYSELSDLESPQRIHKTPS